jgi:hypothetical protein
VNNDLHSEKHSQQRISTEFGISICVKPDLENANDSIRCNFDCDLNVIVNNDLHSEKHPQQRISTEFGISICVKPEQENANDSIRCNFDCGSIRFKTIAGSSERGR